MDRPSYTHSFPIESFAVLTEDPAAHRAHLDSLYAFYQPTSPGECDLLDRMATERIRRKRIDAQITELINDQVRQAIYQFDCQQEDLVERYRRMMRSDPGAAVLGLERTALGC